MNVTRKERCQLLFYLWELKKSPRNVYGTRPVAEQGPGCSVCAEVRRFADLKAKGRIKKITDSDKCHSAPSMVCTRAWVYFHVEKPTSSSPLWIPRVPYAGVVSTAIFQIRQHLAGDIITFLLRSYL